MLIGSYTTSSRLILSFLFYPIKLLYASLMMGLTIEKGLRPNIYQIIFRPTEDNMILKEGARFADTPSFSIISKLFQYYFLTIDDVNTLEAFDNVNLAFCNFHAVKIIDCEVSVCVGTYH